MESVFRFFRRIIYSYKQTSIISDWKAYFLFDLIPPISQTLFFSLIASYIYGVEYIQKWMVGNALLIASFNSLFGVGAQLILEKYNGTLSLLIASKTRLKSILLSSAIGSMIMTIISVVTGLVVVSMILNISWTSNLIFSFIVVLLVATFVSVSFGYIFSCLILITSETNLVLNLISRILLIFTGANFPISKLPYILQCFSGILPLTRSIKIAKGLIAGKPLSTYYNLIFEELTLSFTFLVLASILLHVLERKSRTTGKLEFV
ncbi:TPA: ABC transporter permease [Streptococcus suis]|nr:ABC transporter permease [Streptococcus suis]HEL2028743.1 ABC transporter permease [Streptococcus suis]HEL2028982.1 ABC transporter permease [Streptococcus suis]HEL9644498.1 ABC transporter permease [Streptococcus suis]HEM3869266.1 ABC transporter permease [Streptococcus suis]